MLAAAGLLAGASHGADYHLVARSFSKALPGGASVPMWGFALDADGNLATVGTEVPASPGPRLVVPPSDTTLRVLLRNELPVPISLTIPGQQSAGVPTWDDGTTGSRSNLTQRVRSFTAETAPGATGTYLWTAFRPGTYLYQSGSHPAVQVQMGLYGAATKDAAAGLAYPGVAHVSDAVVLYSEVDPGLHTAVAGGTFGVAPYTSTFEYDPKYFLVNGEPYPQGTPTITGLQPGQPTLLRFLNAGLKTHVAELLGGHLALVAEDGNAYSRARQAYTVFLPAGKTADAVLTPAAAGTYPLFDRALDLTNAGAPDGGLISFLEVGGPPGAPVAYDDSFGVAEDGVLTVAVPGVLGNDSGAGLEALLVSSTGAGSLSLAADGSFSYTPAPDFSGTDLFTYRATDGAQTSNLATVRVAVNPVNDPPVAVADGYSAMAGLVLATTPMTGVLGNDMDMDGEALVAELASGPGHALSFTLRPDGSFSYTAACAYSGTDTFTYRASDGTATSALTPVTISVAVRVNQAPVARDDTASVKTSTPLLVNWVTIPLLANDRDPDAACSGLDPSAIVITGGPTRGGTVIVQPDGTVRFRSKSNFRGTDIFTYRVRDLDGSLSNQATVRVNVTR